MISFQSIEIKVHAQERLTQEEGEFLFSYPDLFAVARLAHTVRSRLHGRHYILQLEPAFKFYKCV